MIPRAWITEWRSHTPWVDDAQVEQDLVISRTLVEIFSDPTLREILAFRGGTALYKLYLTPAARYSEDIDLVQVDAGAAGPMIDALRATLDPWLGDPIRKSSRAGVTLTYRFDSESIPARPLRLKVEINTREHFAARGFTKIPFAVDSSWFHGACEIKTYDLNELIGTKLRALYQRKKGRDLFDLDLALQESRLDPDSVVQIFRQYMDHGGHEVTRSQFLENLQAKLEDRNFASDITPLLTEGFEWDAKRACDNVIRSLVVRLDD